MGLLEDDESFAAEERKEELEDEAEYRNMPSSPVEPSPHPKSPRTPRTPKTPNRENAPSLLDTKAALLEELRGVRMINDVVEKLLQTLEDTKTKMSAASTSVNNAASLVNIYTRILSQTEHSQRLILNPNWHGSTQDLIAIEAEDRQRRLADERRAADETRRRIAEAKAEEEEQQQQQRKAVRETTGSRGARSARNTRGRALARGAAASRAGASAATMDSGASSGIGRGRVARGIARYRPRASR